MPPKGWWPNTGDKHRAQRSKSSMGEPLPFTFTTHTVGRKKAHTFEIAVTAAISSIRMFAILSNILSWSLKKESSGTPSPDNKSIACLLRHKRTKKHSILYLYLDLEYSGRSSLMTRSHMMLWKFYGLTNGHFRVKRNPESLYLWRWMEIYCRIDS